MGVCVCIICIHFVCTTRSIRESFVFSSFCLALRLSFIQLFLLLLLILLFKSNNCASSQVNEMKIEINVVYREISFSF